MPDKNCANCKFSRRSPSFEPCRACCLSGAFVEWEAPESARKATTPKNKQQNAGLAP